MWFKNPTAGLDSALAYVDAMLSPEAQTALSAAPYFYIPSNDTVELPPALVEAMGIESVDDFIAMSHGLDWATINPQRAEWIERFNQVVQALMLLFSLKSTMTFSPFFYSSPSLQKCLLLSHRRGWNPRLPITCDKWWWQPRPNCLGVLPSALGGVPNIATFSAKKKNTQAMA